MDEKLTFKGGFRRLLSYALPYRKKLMGIGVLMIVFALLLNSLPLLLRKVIDSWITEPNQPTASSWGLLVIAGAYLFISITGGVGQYIQGILSAGVGQSILRRIRADVFDKAMHLSLSFYNTTPVGTLITRATSDVDVLQQFVTNGLVGAIADCFMFICVAGFMFYLNVQLAMALFIVLPVALSLLLLANWRLHDANRHIRSAQAKLNAELQESITGMDTIQVFGHEPQIYEQFCNTNDELLDASLKEVKWFSFYFPVIELSQVAGAILVLFYGIYSMKNNGSVTVGMIVAFLAYLKEFFRPIQNLSDKAGLYQQARASCERVFALLDTPISVQDTANPKPLADKTCSSLEFKHVWFAYHNEDWVLKDISFSISSGEHIAIVGATGAGKSTVAQLIPRFYDIQRGMITCGGVDIREVQQQELRHRIALVPQEPFIFSGSIMDNIRLYNPNVSEKDAIEAAEYVHAAPFINRLPQAYRTICGERGTRLSTGQKQLIALARAFLLNKCEILILDEATASVDSETEVFIMQALHNLSRGKTSITIAHRLSTIRHADRILVMQNGHIIAKGKHENLMTDCPYYNRLYQLLVEEQIAPSV